eukprot:scaffold229069_cov18-Prasinocladus_malaysianus.AAC.1
MHARPAVSTSCTGTGIGTTSRTSTSCDLQNSSSIPLNIEPRLAGMCLLECWTLVCMPWVEFLSIRFVHRFTFWVPGWQASRRFLIFCLRSFADRKPNQPLLYPSPIERLHR